ncbi:CsxC family protein [Bacillus paramycoides]|uniref:CsxC family protein n=1 Tax=Bacillus paramycoides TaxID=2026194 RepID=UPI003D05B5B3
MNQQQGSCSQQQQTPPCTDGVTSVQQTELDIKQITPGEIHPINIYPILKTPVVVKEAKLQIVVESTITLNPPATEIKRVKKHVFLDQVKLVPVKLEKVEGTHNLFKVKKAKLFVAGHIRKNIEYAGATAGTNPCNGPLQDRIADVKFNGFAEINHFLTDPLLSTSKSFETNFVDDTGLNARLDKAFFQNFVQYNEQPFGELVSADFFELDFSPIATTPEGTFGSFTEKIVLDLTLKVLQIQQIKVTGTQVSASVHPPHPPHCP